jgi:hypothetical protein
MLAYWCYHVCSPDYFGIEKCSDAKRSRQDNAELNVVVSTIDLEKLLTIKFPSAQKTVLLLKYLHVDYSEG